MKFNKIEGSLANHKAGIDRLEMQWAPFEATCSCRLRLVATVAAAAAVVGVQVGELLLQEMWRLSSDGEAGHWEWVLDTLN